MIPKRLVWIACIVAFIAIAPNLASADQITVQKKKRQLTFTVGTAVHQFRIGLGTQPFGAKRKQGDRRTPEGHYFITHKNPKSQFYLSLGISYPNVNDAQYGLEAGLITNAQFRLIEKALAERKLPPQNTRLGGDLFIHGHGSSSDWTWGCIALDDADMKFLYDNVVVGTPVVVNP